MQKKKKKKKKKNINKEKKKKQIKNCKIFMINIRKHFAFYFWECPLNGEENEAFSLIRMFAN